MEIVLYHARYTVKEFLLVLVNPTPLLRTFAAFSVLEERNWFVEVVLCNLAEGLR